LNLFIGTLYSGENEYEECVRSIQTQTYPHYKHFVFKDLPNREAHNNLFSSFLEKKAVYNLLIKVDADMVLCSDTLFDSIVNKMSKSPELEIFSIAVMDFFSGQLINGLNTYRNTVRWDYSNTTMFVDIPDVPTEKTQFDANDLAPAAIHCKNPSKLQAFHYGVHRGLKSIAKQHSTSHWALLNKTWQNFLRTKDERIGLAVLGAELVYAGIFTKTDVDYTNPRVKHVLEKYETMCIDDLKHEISTLKIRHWGFLPGDMRRRLLRQKYKNW